MGMARTLTLAWRTTTGCPTGICGHFKVCGYGLLKGYARSKKKKKLKKD